MSCKLSSSSSKELPTRVINVGNLNQDPRICVPVKDRETSTRYLILSYCWGRGNDIAKTTRANFEARRRKIVLKELPKTIRDAIILTRALGGRFLWVDAICIKQPVGNTDDETRDWREQAPKMGQYYRDSICTIAASRAADSSEGFLCKRLG